MSLLKMNIIGHLGQDAEVKEFSGNYVINFSVAHTSKRKGKNNEEISTTTWIRCSYWKDSQDKTKVANYLKKGTQVFVEGLPSAVHFSTNNGEVVSRLECRVYDLILLGSSKNSNLPSSEEESSSNYESNSEQRPEMKEENDDLPF